MRATKDSGVDWLGEIPADWEVRPCWSSFRRVKQTGFPEEELLSVYRDHGVVPKSSRDDNHNVESEDLTSYQLVRVGDMVMNKMKAWQGSIALSDHRGIVSPAYFVYRPTQEFSRKYFHYLLRSAPYVAHYNRISKGVRVGQWDLDPTYFRTTSLIVPPLDEQRRIADFLDRETAKIDVLIAKQEELVTTLDERRRVKVSGVIAEFSEKASSKRVSAVARLVNGFPFDSELFDSSGEVPLVRIRDISSDEFETFVPRVSVPGRALIRNGDVVVGMDGDFNLRLWDRGAAALNQRLCLLRTDEPVIASWIAYCLPTPLKNINDLTYATTVKHLSSNQIARIMIPMPSVSELNTVVRELDRYVLRIERLVRQTREMLTLLRERRQSLISAAVTGKLEVSG